jgi:hypothetical protein
MSAPARVTYEQLLAAPELASLAVLEAALDVTGVALAAAWPELHDIDMAREHDEPRAALDVLRRAADLVAAVNRYRLVLAVAQHRKHDLPF